MCLHFLNKNTDDLDPSILPLHPATPSNSEDMTSLECPTKGTTSLPHHCLETPKKATGGSFTKIKVPLVKDLSAWNTPPRKSDRNRPPPHISGRITRSPPKSWQRLGLQTDSVKTREAACPTIMKPPRHTRVMISHHVLVLQRRGLALKKSDSSTEPQQKYSIISSYCSPHRKNPQPQGIGIRAD